MLAKLNQYVRPQSLLRAFLVGLWCCCCSLIPKLHTICGWILFAAYKTYDSITIYLRDSFDCALCIVSSSSNCSTDTNKSSLGFCEARKYYLCASIQESEAEEEFWEMWSLRASRDQQCVMWLQNGLERPWIEARWGRRGEKGQAWGFVYMSDSSENSVKAFCWSSCLTWNRGLIGIDSIPLDVMVPVTKRFRAK